MTDELIMLCAEAARVACLRMAPHHLKVLNDSAEQASCMARFEWDRKVTAHAEFFNLLADAACDPALSTQLKVDLGCIYDLMVSCGPGADRIILNSRGRLLALMRAGDADAAAWEMQRHLRGLRLMGRLVNPAALRQGSCVQAGGLGRLAGWLRGRVQLGESPGSGDDHSLA